jgi:hypothetical protein
LKNLWFSPKTWPTNSAYWQLPLPWLRRCRRQGGPSRHRGPSCLTAWWTLGRLCLNMCSGTAEPPTYRGP